MIRTQIPHSSGFLFFSRIRREKKQENSKKKISPNRFRKTDFFRKSSAETYEFSCTDCRIFLFVSDRKKHILKRIVFCLLEKQSPQNSSKICHGS